MSERLYLLWLEQEGINVEKAVFAYGVHGILDLFESWLRKNGCIPPEPQLEIKNPPRKFKMNLGELFPKTKDIT